MRPMQATVYQRAEEFDLARVVTITYTSAGTVNGVFLPTGGEIVQRQYGMEYAGEFEFYTKRRNSALVAGNRLQIGGVDYDIIAVRDYVKAMTVLLRQVVDVG